MKARPILFSGPMVRALLDGRKTQTRRIVKPRHIPIVEECLLVNGKWVYDALDFDLGAISGRTGDLLWVRESLRLFNTVHVETGEHGLAAYWAAGGGDGQTFVWNGKSDTTGIPSLHTPRWASRLTLELTEVRVERLQDISKEDAIAEGATSRQNCSGFNDQFDGWSMDWSNVGIPSRWAVTGFLAEREVSLASPTLAFGAFINHLHGGPNWNLKSQAPIWDQNPFVWALSFRVHHQNVDTFLKERLAA